MQEAINEGIELRVEVEDLTNTIEKMESDQDFKFE